MPQHLWCECDDRGECHCGNCYMFDETIWHIQLYLAPVPFATQLEMDLKKTRCTSKTWTWHQTPKYLVVERINVKQEKIPAIFRTRGCFRALRVKTFDLGFWIRLVKIYVTKGKVDVNAFFISTVRMDAALPSFKYLSLFKRFLWFHFWLLLTKRICLGYDRNRFTTIQHIKFLSFFGAMKLKH